MYKYFNETLDREKTKLFSLLISFKECFEIFKKSLWKLKSIHQIYVFYTFKMFKNIFVLFSIIIVLN